LWHQSPLMGKYCDLPVRGLLHPPLLQTVCVMRASKLLAGLQGLVRVGWFCKLLSGLVGSVFAYCLPVVLHTRELS